MGEQFRYQEAYKEGAQSGGMDLEKPTDILKLTDEQVEAYVRRFLYSRELKNKAWDENLSAGDGGNESIRPRIARMMHEGALDENVERAFIALKVAELKYLRDKTEMPVAERTKAQVQISSLENKLEAALKLKEEGAEYDKKIEV